MSAQTIFYLQKVPIDGYKVVQPGSLSRDMTKLGAKDTPCLALNNEKGRHRLIGAEDIKSNTFLEFAGLELNEEAVIRFANANGFLGLNNYSYTKGKKGGVVLLCEPLFEWYKEIQRMRSFVNLAKHLTFGKAGKKELKKVIDWSPARESELRTGEPILVKFKPNDSFSSWLFGTNYKPHLLEQCSYGDVTLPAMVALQDMVNTVYKEHVDSRLLFDREYKSLAHHIVPSTLLGIMWLQLAQSTEKGKKYKNCEECSKPMILERQRGKPRKYCSDACKSRNHREKYVKIN